MNATTAGRGQNKFIYSFTKYVTERSTKLKFYVELSD